MSDLSVTSGSEPMRTLHVDIEGGWGGSSRSLWQLIARFDRDRIEPMVVHRQAGPVSDRYAQIDVPTRHIPEIASYVPRASRSLATLVVSIPRLLKVPVAADQIAAAARSHRAQLIHLNYEGLFLVSRSLRSRCGLPMIAHCRALLPENALARWLAHSLSRSVDHLFFISPQEQQRFAALAGRHAPPDDLMWNIARPAEIGRVGDEPEAVFLGNIDISKGVFRLIDIAERLRANDAPPLKIAAYGSARNSPGLVDRLHEETARRGLSDRLQFRGHTSAPENVLRTALALIRPSLSNDPWGRDVIEAAAHGVPVLATGTFQGVVEHGRTGYLFEPFDADAMARTLISLAKDPEERKQMGAAAREKAVNQFHGDKQARLFETVAQRLVGRQSGRLLT